MTLEIAETPQRPRWCTKLSSWSIVAMYGV